MARYQVLNLGISSLIHDTERGYYIPIDDGPPMPGTNGAKNQDYLNYLAWVDEGNEPDLINVVNPPPEE